MGLFGIISGVLGLLVTAAAGGAAYLYATDAPVEATVTDKDCFVSEIAVKTKNFGLDHKVRDVPTQECAVIQVGNFVQYHLRTERTIVYASEGGACLYDSKTGTC